MLIPLNCPDARVRDAIPTSFAARPRRRVLVVEDNADAAEMLGMLVETLGHDVRIAGHANEGLAILDDWHADVVLSDLGLPDVDGFEFARRLRARREYTTATLVAVSGYGRAEDAARSREAGFDSHLTKPLDAATLARVLEWSSAGS